MSGDDTRMIGSGYHYAPLEWCVQVTRDRRDLVVEFEPGTLSWRSSWMVLTKNDHGGVAVVDCSARGELSPVYSIDNPPEVHPLYFQPRVHSIAEMVSWWIEAIEAGQTGFDRDRGGWFYNFQEIPRERELTRLV